MPANPEKNPLRRTLTVIGGVYALLVVLLALNVPLPLQVVHRDSLEYIRLASNLSEHGVFGFEPSVPSARRELLYPLFLAAFMKVGLVTPFDSTAANFWPVLAAQAGLWVAALAMLGERARRLVPDAAARIAVVLGAAYFPVAKYAFQILSEALTIALVSAFFYFLARRETAADGKRLTLSALMLGLLGLLKSVTLPAAPLVAGFLLWARRVSWRLAVLFTLVALCVPAPWLGRNYVHFGKFKSTTDGASTLYRGNMMLGHQPQSFSDPKIPEQVRAERARLGDDADRYLVDQVKQRFSDSPGEYVLQLGFKLIVLWVGLPWSSDGPVNFALRCAMLLLIASRLSIFVKSPDPDARLVVLFSLYLTVLYTLILTTPRYFAPAVFVLLPAAASALHGAWALFTARLVRLRA